MKLLISAIALSVLAASPAIAAKNDAKKDESKWFVNLSLGVIASSESEDQAIEDLTALGHDITGVDFDQNTKGYIFELGYQLNESWAVSAGYLDFGEAPFNVASSTGYSVQLVGDLLDAAPRFGNGNTYSVIYSLPVADSIIASVDAGVLYLETESVVTIDVSDDDEPVYYEYSDSEHSLQYFLGAALEYQYQKMRVGVQVRHYDINGVGTQWVGARIAYHF
jgi:hypothetical protein